MSMQHYSVIVRGKKHRWTFTVKAKPKWVQDWRHDGIKVDLLQRAPLSVRIKSMLRRILNICGGR